jgi:hypothetical protein
LLGEKEEVDMTALLEMNQPKARVRVRVKVRVGWG